MRLDTPETLLSFALILVAIMSPYGLIDKKDPSGKVQRGEYALVLTLLTVTLLLRVVYIFHYRFRSDETQHLHVVWGWAHGLLQYRDIFDNHAPLFHLFCTPLFLAFGERPEVLFFMRLAMLPFYGLMLWSTYTIGCVLFSSRVGLWAAVLTGLFPTFFFCSLEFRTDDLWTALWLAALAVLVAGHLTRARSFTVGVILGTAVGVSMKTTLLLASLGAAALASIILTAQSRSQLFPRHLCQCAAVALVGLLWVPLALTLFFAVEGAWTPFFYGIITHNTAPGLGLWHEHPERALFFPAMLPFVWWGAYTIGRRAPSARIGIRWVVVFLAAEVYISALLGFWPLLERQDYLPFYPLSALFLTSTILALLRWIGARTGSIEPSHSLPAALGALLVAVLEILVLLQTAPPWRDRTRAKIDLLTDVLRLTQPGDLVMDTKGETVFRRRPFYYALETITRERIQRGFIADSIPERLIATGTAVAVADDDRLPPRGRAFLQENYLPVGRLRVVGHLLLPPTSDKGSATLPFDVQIPTRYAIVAEWGEAAGWLDGTVYEGVRLLTSGHHEFRPSSEVGRFALVWAQAVERGFSPFPLRGESP